MSATTHPKIFSSGTESMIQDHPNGEAPKNSAQLARSESSASASVIEALRQLRNRSPEEMLGVNSKSGLRTACLQATAGAVAIILLLTIIPYFVAKAEKKNAAPETPAKEVAPEPRESASPTTPATKTEPDKVAKKNSGTDPEKPLKKKELIDKLGESGVKTGKPSLNPLDKKDDDLFKD
jgi:hypothetical protein